MRVSARTCVLVTHWAVGVSFLFCEGVERSVYCDSEQPIRKTLF